MSISYFARKAQMNVDFNYILKLVLLLQKYGWHIAVNDIIIQKP